MRSKVTVTLPVEITIPIRLSDIPDETAFIGTISGNTGLFFKNHIGIMMLDAPPISSGGTGWSLDYLNSHPNAIASNYQKVNLKISVELAK